jgi:hypothetical protein
MDKTRNIYVLLTLSISVAILVGTFIVVFNMGVLRNTGSQESEAIERLREINQENLESMNNNTQIIIETKAAIDSFMAYDQIMREQEAAMIKTSRNYVSQIPHLSNDSLQKTYNNSWNYLLNEYRSGRLMPSE